MASSKLGTTYAKAMRGDYFKTESSAFDKLRHGNVQKLKEQFRAMGVPEHRISQAVNTYLSRG